MKKFSLSFFVFICLCQVSVAQNFPPFGHLYELGSSSQAPNMSMNVLIPQDEVKSIANNSALVYAAGDSWKLLNNRMEVVDTRVQTTTCSTASGTSTCLLLGQIKAGWYRFQVEKGGNTFIYDFGVARPRAKFDVQTSRWTEADPNSPFGINGAGTWNEMILLKNAGVEWFGNEIQGGDEAGDKLGLYTYDKDNRRSSETGYLGPDPLDKHRLWIEEMTRLANYEMPLSEIQSDDMHTINVFERAKLLGFKSVCRLLRAPLWMHPNWNTTNPNMGTFSWENSANCSIEKGKEYLFPPDEAHWNNYRYRIQRLTKLAITRYDITDFEFICEPANYIFTGSYKNDNGSWCATREYPLLETTQKLFYYTRKGIRDAIPTSGLTYTYNGISKTVKDENIRYLGVGDIPYESPYPNAFFNRFVNGYTETSGPHAGKTLKSLMDFQSSKGSNYKLDVFTIHPYFQDGIPEGNSKFSDSNRGIQNTLRQSISDVQGFYKNSTLANAASDIPLWATEGSYCSIPDNDIGGHHTSEVIQGNLLPRYYINGLAAGYSKLFWYLFVDLIQEKPTSTPVDSKYLTYSKNDPILNSHGLLRSTGTIKPSYLAYRTMTEQLEGLSLNGPIQNLKSTNVATSGQKYNLAKFSSPSFTSSTGTTGGKEVWAIWKTREDNNLLTSIPCAWTKVKVTRNDGSQEFYPVRGQSLMINLQSDAVVYVENDTDANRTYTTNITTIGEINNVVDPQGYVTGWAYDPDIAGQTIEVEMCIDGGWVSGGGEINNRCSGRVSANLKSENINYTRSISGNHGFKIKIPSQFLDGKAHVVNVYLVGITNQGLSNDGITLTKTLTFPGSITTRKPIGKISGIDPYSGKLSVWGFDPDVPSEPLLMQVCYDLETDANNNPQWNNSRCAPRFYTDGLRTDINRDYNITGNHGYGISLPGSSQPLSADGINKLPNVLDPDDGIDHRIYVYAIDHLNTGKDNVLIDAGDFSPKPYIVKNERPFGKVESIDANGKITGWGLDPSSPFSKLTVKVDIDAPGGSTTLANLARADVNTLTGYPGDHGFEYTVPSRFLNDADEHSLWLYLFDIEDPTYFQMITLKIPKGFNYAKAIDLGTLSAIGCNNKIQTQAVSTKLDNDLISLYADNFNSSNSGYLTGQPSPDVYFQYKTDNSNIYVEISTCNSDFNTFLHLKSKSNFPWEYENDDRCGNRAKFIYATGVTEPKFEFREHYLIVEGKGRATGNVVLDIMSSEENSNSSCINLREEGIEIVNNQEILIHPNPASTEVTIKTFRDEISIIQILDIRGNLLKTITNNLTDNILSTQEYPSGLYIINIINSSGTVRKKLEILK